MHYNWHWFWESGNGDLNNQGTHQLDRLVPAPGLADEILKLWLETPFAGGRHQRRIEQITDIENGGT